MHAAEPIAYLTTLVVDREARNRGIGRRLVDKVAEWAGRLGAARLSAATGTQRTESHRIYERLGFERTGFRYSRSLAKQPP